MGKILYLKCNKDEIHQQSFFVGIGMMFPEVYADIIKKIKKGKYGKEIKKFLEENPQGAINCESEIAYCPECGNLKEVVNLSMYIQKNNNEKTDKSYVMSWELKEKYKKVKEYKHICSKCSSEMKIIKVKEDKYGILKEDKNGNLIKNMEIKCPKCDGLMEITDGGCWD